MRFAQWILAGAFLAPVGVMAQKPAAPAFALAAAATTNTTTAATLVSEPAADDWYPCSGTFTVDADGKQYGFTNLQVRKIDGQSFEMKAKPKEGTAPDLHLYIETFNPTLILRPNMTYVSEGNLEAGETFTLALKGATPTSTMTSKSTGCVMHINSVRGSAVKGDVKGVFETSRGAKPFEANFDLIDSRYGR
jgi:hypothetical protein